MVVVNGLGVSPIMSSVQAYLYGYRTVSYLLDRGLSTCPDSGGGSRWDPGWLARTGLSAGRKGGAVRG